MVWKLCVSCGRSNRITVIFWDIEMATIYKINKGINKPIQFKGLKAQYITYLGIGMVVLLILFASLYIIGVNLYLCILIVGSLGLGLFMTVIRLSHKYGEHGLLKRLARKYIPVFIRFKSRRLFIYLDRNMPIHKARRKYGKAH